MKLTYILFLSLRRKTPSLLFMLRKERRSVVRKNKDIHASEREIPLLCAGCRSYNSKLTSCNFDNIFRKSAPYSILVLLMQYDVWCDAMRNDVMKWCKMIMMPKTHTYTPTLEHNFCIPLGTTEISLPFIFRLHRLFFGVSSASP
jgi:hypothetical protein